MIELTDGPMYAGKSTHLFWRIGQLKWRGRRCLVVTHAADCRYSAEDCAVTHDGARHPARRCTRLADVPAEEVAACDVIGVDEAQFFPDLVEETEAWARAGKHVLVYGLNGDFRREPFDVMARLAPNCEHITHLSAGCACGSEAHFSQRLGPETAQIDVGGAEKYVARCRKCFIR